MIEKIETVEVVKSYQIFPEMTPEEFESLKASIAEHGVDVPVIVDQEGNIVDGYHRQKACDELKVPCPKEIREFKDETDKLELSLRLNCSRRQLGRAQKRELITNYLSRDPQIANNHLGEIIGVSQNTVADVRAELEAKSEIQKFESLRGKDGKKRPSKYKKIITNTPNETTKALKAIHDLPEKCSGKTIDITTANRLAAKNRNAESRKQQHPVTIPASEESIRLYHCPFQDLADVAGIEPNSVQLICTDIPYGQDFLPQVEALGQFAKRVLVDGGIFLTYAGQFWMHKDIELLSKSLTYRWVNASVWRGDANPVSVGGWKEPHARVLSNWKPILIFSNGGFPLKGQWNDVSYVEDKEKDWHEWQQPLAEVEKLIRDFSDPGDLVVDPCGGSFTTAVACSNLNRRFIGCDVDEDSVGAGQERLRQLGVTTTTACRVEEQTNHNTRTCSQSV